MQINFTPASKIVYSIDTVSPPAAWQSMLQELQQLSWHHEPTIGEQGQYAVSCLAPHVIWQDCALRQFQEHFTAPTFKQQLLDVLFTNQEFLMAWAMPDREYVDAVTKLAVNWIATPARYNHHPWHTDCRNQMAFGMIYFTEQDNPLHSTWFDTGQHGHLLRMPSAPGQGWMVINTDQARHCGMNDTDHVRYSLKFSLDLAVKKS
jgi:hypothetical protein